MTFNIIHHLGKVKEATTSGGIAVKPLGQVFTQEYGLVKCVDYDDHFIYENPDTRAGTMAYLCTCGSMAVVANPYHAGKMFVCHHHATFGFHQTSQVNKKDFEAGKPVIRKGRRWV